MPEAELTEAYAASSPVCGPCTPRLDLISESGFTPTRQSGKPTTMRDETLKVLMPWPPAATRRR